VVRLTDDESKDVFRNKNAAFSNGCYLHGIRIYVFRQRKRRTPKNHDRKSIFVNGSRRVCRPVANICLSGPTFVAYDVTKRTPRHVTNRFHNWRAKARRTFRCGRTIEFVGLVITTGRIRNPGEYGDLDGCRFVIRSRGERREKTPREASRRRTAEGFVKT